MDKENSLKKLPKSITILGRKFKIVQKKVLMYQDKPVLGLCDPGQKIIYLSKDQTDKEKLETLYHECVHGMLNISGIDQSISESENEIMCQLFTALFHDLITSLEFNR